MPKRGIMAELNRVVRRLENVVPGGSKRRKKRTGASSRRRANGQFKKKK